MSRPSPETASRGLLAGFFIAAGVMHFVAPGAYERITPGWVPHPREVVYLSGVAEIAGGAMVLVPHLRPFAGPYLVALLAAVFPANLQMAFEAERHSIAPALLWLRLPLQPLAMWWAWRATRER